MTLQELLEQRQHAKRQILFHKEDACLQSIQDMVDTLPRRAVVSWALDLAGEAVAVLEQKYPEDSRARATLECAQAWAAGTIKMPIAKKAILCCHAAAKERTAPEDIALYHAIAQACSTIHTTGHALGYPLYDLTALMRTLPIELWEAAALARIDHYTQRLLYWSEHFDRDPEHWADFLCK